MNIYFFEINRKINTFKQFTTLVFNDLKSYQQRLIYSDFFINFHFINSKKYSQIKNRTSDAKIKIHIFAKNKIMKKSALFFLFFFVLVVCEAQVPLLHEHTFPQITSPNERVEEMLEQIKTENIASDVEHLSSYINRRADAVHIYNVKDWLVSEYEKMNVDSIYLHDFQVIPYWDTVPKPFTTAPNVLALQRGKTKPDEFVICGAHYDSYVVTDGDFDPDTLISPGADDNATGVAGILATARILSNYEFERSIIYANWNAEEFGLCGSHVFAMDCVADSVDIVAYFNLDMTGYLNPGDDIHIHLLYVNRDSLLGKFVKQVGNTYLPGINIAHAWLSSGNTDHSSFNGLGYQAISPSEDVHKMSPYIHTVNDIIGLSVNNWEQTVVFTKLNLASVAHAAGLISESVDEIDFDMEIDSFEVFDILGRKVYSEKNVSKNIDEIRVTNLESGIYIVRFFTKNGHTTTKKFFVTH